MSGCHATSRILQRSARAQSAKAGSGTCRYGDLNRPGLFLPHRSSRAVLIKDGESELATAVVRLQVSKRRNRRGGELGGKWPSIGPKSNKPPSMTALLPDGK